MISAASRHSPAGRHFLLHVPLTLLHARHLSGRVAANEVTARFHSRGFVFPAVRGRADRARG